MGIDGNYLSAADIQLISRRSRLHVSLITTAHYQRDCRLPVTLLEYYIIKTLLHNL